MSLCGQSVPKVYLWLANIRIVFSTHAVTYFTKIIVLLIAILALGLPFNANAQEEISLYDSMKLKAEQGDAKAQCYLGDHAPNKDEAESWYRLAAEQGDPEGQYSLGSSYISMHETRKFSGTETTQRKKSGAKLILQAADQGYKYAYRDLAYCYAEGVGVKKDLIESAAYANLEVMYGLCSRNEILDKIEKKSLNPSQISSAKRRAFALKAKIEAKKSKLPASK
jgi:hypothetical protein